MNGATMGMRCESSHRERRNEVLEHLARLTKTQPAYTGGIVATGNCIRCAYCGKNRNYQSVIIFALLNEGCKTLGVRLKAPRSIAFDPLCARRAFRAIQKVNPTLLEGR